MKAILWKELRENYRWALLGSVVLVLAEFYMLSKLEAGFDSSDNITLTDSSFLMVNLFGSALIAVGLGALQILPERNRDRWAALLHRPVSRGVIFRGKAVAGLGLYAGAVLLPFAASACFVAWPGKFAAPFVPQLLLPGLHALAGGVAFYFGSLLLCLHRGRWLGTRGVLLLAVGGVFLLQMTSTGPFLLLPVVAATVMSLAAAHAMLDEGSAERGGAVRWVAYLIVILFGAQEALFLAGTGLSLLPGSEKSVSFGYTELVVTPEGQVLRQSSGGNDESPRLTDMAGKPVTDERYLGNDSYRNLLEFWPLSYEILKHRRGSYTVSEHALLGLSYVQGLRRSYQDRENWFLLLRRNYFIGYDKLSRRCIGICDREGFKAPDAKPVPFEGPLEHSFYNSQDPSWFWTDHRLYAVYFADRRLQPFFFLPDGVITAAMPLPLRESTEGFRYVLLGTENGLQMLDAKGLSVYARPYLHDPRRWTALEVATNPKLDRFYLRSESGFSRNETERRNTTYLDELNPHGEVLHRYDATIDNRVAPDPLWLTSARACLLPVAPVVVEKLYQLLISDGPPDRSLFGVGEVRTGNLAVWTTMVALALALAAVAFFQARRVGFAARRAWGWTALVFAFGPAGFLAFRLASGWPERVRCPFCGYPRSLREDTCPQCRQAWNAPLPTGTEILQPLPVHG